MMAGASAYCLGVCVLLTGVVVTPALGRHPGVPLTEVMSPVAAGLIIGALALVSAVLAVIILKLLRRHDVPRK